MEKGYRYMGTDLTAGDTPYEAGLGFCVAMDKGDFTGREALAAASEPKRRLRTLLVRGEGYLTLYGGEAVRVNGDTAGRVRSCAYGHTIGATIAYVYLPADLTDDAAIEVEVLGTPTPARLVADVLVGSGLTSA